MSKFNVGDRIRAIDDERYSITSAAMNWEGVVTGFTDENHINVQSTRCDWSDYSEAEFYKLDERCFELIPPEETEKNMEAEVKTDNVNAPAHYNREGAMQSIDEMVAVFGKEVVAHFCLCNVWKYRYRAADKNGAEDIAKSDWYMRKYMELTGVE